MGGVLQGRTMRTRLWMDASALANKKRFDRLHLIVSLLIGLSAGLGLVLVLSHFRH